MTRARAQLVLLAAAVVVAALVPMVFAYAQLGYDADVRGAPDARATVTDAQRLLERAVGSAASALDSEVGPDQHEALAREMDDRLAPAVSRLAASGADRDLTVSVERNATAARAWAADACPGGPTRQFGACVVTDGVVTQTRANTTTVVAVAFDLHVRGPQSTTEATVVVRAVGGVVARERRRPGRVAGLKPRRSLPRV